MYYYSHLKVFIENPEQYSEKISYIIAAAAHADSTIKSFLLVLANPMNGEMWAANPTRFINEQINILWSAATLMLAIAKFKTKENINVGHQRETALIYFAFKLIFNSVYLRRITYCN